MNIVLVGIALVVVARGSESGGGRGGRRNVGGGERAGGLGAQDLVAVLLLDLGRDE